MKILFVAAMAAMFATASIASEPVTPIAELKRGTMTTVSGTVERITDEDEFRLTDATGSVRVYVGPNWVPANVGEKVSVSGFVDDDYAFLEIYARSMIREDGSTVSFNHRYE